jgi:hypothetical protein
MDALLYRVLFMGYNSMGMENRVLRRPGRKGLKPRVGYRCGHRMFSTHNGWIVKVKALTHIFQIFATKGSTNAEPAAMTTPYGGLI